MDKIYTANDMESMRKEAWENGYKRGIGDEIMVIIGFVMFFIIIWLACFI
jgi:hypothetical protein